jgi:hypothetical protein
MYTIANITLTIRNRFAVRADVAFPGFDFGMPDLFRR